MFERHRVSMNEAAHLLVKSRKVTSLAVARKALIAALMEDKLVACCEAFWRYSIPRITRREDHVPWDSGVPADFWRLDHADDSSIEPGYTFSGPWASWSKSNFHLEIDLTGSTAALRYHDFEDLSVYGSKPVQIYFNAMDVSLNRFDVDRLCRRSPGNLGRLIRKASERPSIRLGNVTSSDRDDIIARLCACMICDADDNAEGMTQDKILKMLLAIAPSVSAELHVSDRSFRQFAAKVEEQIFKEYQSRSRFPPSV